MRKTILLLCVFAAATFGQGPAEKAGKAVDSAASEVKKDTVKAAKATEKAATPLVDLIASIRCNAFMPPPCP